MPTGYTADIKDGISFKEFALDCSRGFGALIHLRDSPNADIPDKVEPNRYHKEQLEECKAKLKKVNMMSDKDLVEKEKNAIQESIEYNKKAIEENKELKAKYEDMLEKVKAWEPPSEDHKNFKQFMIDQIESSINYDCRTSYYTESIREMENRKIDSAYRIRQDRIEEIQDSIEYHKKHWEEDKQRAKEKTEWIQKLKKSLQDYE